MNEERKHKCYFNKDSVFKPCKGLDTNVNWQGDTGLIAPELFNFTNGECRIIGIVYKRLKKDKGIYLNVCPFCGEKILNDKKQLNTDNVPYYDGV